MSRLLLLANDESTIYNFRREIVKAFTAAGHEVFISYPKGEHDDEITALGATLISSSVNRHGTSITEDIKYLFSCVKLIKKIKPDVVLTYTVKPNIYGSIACQLTRTKYINNITGLGSILQNGGQIAKLIIFLQKIGYRKSSCVFFQNKDNYMQMLDKKVINKSTPYVILPGSGVNLSLHCAEDYPQDDTVTKFIIVSRVRKDKGYDEFFQAAEHIKKTHPDTEFHIVGWYEDDYYKSLIEKLEKENIVIYHGKKNPSEVHDLLKDSHCLVHPSYHEGMANVILEASATARPVLASNIPGCIEGFDEEKTGFGFMAQDTDSLIASIEKFISIPYTQKKEMGILARKKMEQEFDRNFVAEAYLNQIKGLEF